MTHIRIISLTFYPNTVDLETGEAIPSHYLCRFRIHTACGFADGMLLDTSRRRILDALKSICPNVIVG